MILGGGVMKLRSLILIASLLLIGACSYSVGGTDVTISVLLSPADATTQQPIDVEITAEFSGEIEVPTDWSTVFTVKKGGSGDNLCTDYNYDGGRHIAYCLHDDLENNTSYQSLVNGILAVNGAVAMWHTEE
jgi:hypothetical protein